jgi:hypothetical protein
MAGKDKWMVHTIDVKVHLGDLKAFDEDACLVLRDPTMVEAERPASSDRRRVMPALKRRLQRINKA